MGQALYNRKQNCSKKLCLTFRSCRSTHKRSTHTTGLPFLLKVMYFCHIKMHYQQFDLVPGSCSMSARWRVCSLLVKMRNWISLGTSMRYSSNWLYAKHTVSWAPVTSSPLKKSSSLVWHSALLPTLCRTDRYISNTVYWVSRQWSLNPVPFVCKFMRLALTSTGSLLLWYFPGDFWVMISSWKWVSGMYWLSQK